MPKPKPNYYSIIPANVRYDERLKANEKLLYGEIAALVNKDGYCLINNGYFGELFKVSNNTISIWIKKLEEKNYIESGKTTPETIANIIKNKDFTGDGIGNQICEWCGINTMSLEKHHYPIPKSKGGGEIVLLCPNCHREFHSMERKIKITNIEEINHIKQDLKIRWDKIG